MKAAFDFQVPPQFKLFSKLSDSIDLRIGNVAASNATKSLYEPYKFASENPGARDIQINSKCWAADMDLTCLSMWGNQIRAQNSSTTQFNQMASTLISPRHVIMARHYSTSGRFKAPHNLVRFLDSNGRLVSRRIIDDRIILHPDKNQSRTDIRIGLLDEEVPETITPAKVLPDDWFEFLPRIRPNNLLPVLYFNQHKRASIGELQILVRTDNATASILMPTRGPNPVTDPRRKPFAESLYSGDSGNPVFLVYGKQPILLTTFLSLNNGPSVIFYKKQINAAMNEMSEGYQLSEINFELLGYQRLSRKK